MYGYVSIFFCIHMLLKAKGNLHRDSILAIRNGSSPYHQAYSN